MAGETQALNIRPEVQQARRRFGIVGNTPALIEAIERAVRVAPFDLSVLITGESGTGKEFFPQIIHQFGSRKHAKYIAVNCGAIPEGTIDSELFGHEKGAFTGAIASRKGYFEEADGGTIFLDEVAELPLTTQARLLRVLETGEFLKVGSSEVQKTNIRIVAATNVDMMRAISEGRFREDLYYRLSTVQITIPPLRRRGNDILLLANKFAIDFAEKYRMPAITLSPEAAEAILSYSWPGNVRQLKNITEQIALFEAGEEISRQIVLHYLPEEASKRDTAAMVRHSAHNYEQEREMLLNMIFTLRKDIDELRKQMSAREDHAVKELPHEIPPTVIVKRNEVPTVIDVSAVEPVEIDERELIRQALERNDGRRREAARELGMTERMLYRKIKEYGLE